MPWPPGSRPVMNVDQATGLSGGSDVPSGANVPLPANRAKLGSRPCSINSRVNVKSRPSNPSTTTRGEEDRGDRQARQVRSGRATITYLAYLAYPAYLLTTTPRALFHPYNLAGRSR